MLRLIRSIYKSSVCQLIYCFQLLACTDVLKPTRVHIMALLHTVSKKNVRTDVFPHKLNFYRCYYLRMYICTHTNTLKMLLDTKQLWHPFNVLRVHPPSNRKLKINNNKTSNSAIVEFYSFLGKINGT